MFEVYFQNILDVTGYRIPCKTSITHIDFVLFIPLKNIFYIIKHQQIRVRRVFDKETNNLIYASFSTRFDKGNDANKGRFKSSICAIHID